MNELYQKMWELKEKGKKVESEGKREKLKSEEVGETEGLLISKGQGSVVMMARRKELFVDHDKDTPMLLLAHCFNTNPTNSSISPLIYLVLQYYEDVFSKELPQGLPPLWGIEHQIDFACGSQLPNKLAYRSNPMDTKELQ